MHRLLLIFLLFSISLRGQEINDYAQDTVTVQIDSADIETRAFSSDLKAKYSNADFVYEVKTAELNFWDRFLAALAQWLRSFFDIATEETSLNIAANIVRVICVVIILFVIYLIVKMILNKEGKWIFGPSGKIIRYEDVESNIHEADFEKLIADSKRLGEKRLTIRYYYLWMLKKMSERGIIIWDAEKTNSDYLYEIKSEEQKSRFAYLSYLYDYIWYGEFPVDDVMFEKSVDAFEQSIRAIR